MGGIEGSRGADHSRDARSAHFDPEIVAELVANEKLVKLPTAETPADLPDADHLQVESPPLMATGHEHPEGLGRFWEALSAALFARACRAAVGH